MRQIVLSAGIPLCALALVVVHRFVYARLPMTRKRGWLLFVGGFAIALIGGSFAVYAEQVEAGANIAWFGGLAAIAGMVWFFYGGYRGDA